MRSVKHINLSDPDGRIYCCLRNKIVKLDEVQKEQFCQSCRMYAGNAGGRGVECAWEDMRSVKDPYIVTSPDAEFNSNQQKRIIIKSEDEKKAEDQ